MLYGKAYVCALLTFAENFEPLVELQDFDKCSFCNFTLWITGAVASFMPLLHIIGNISVF